jgi:hypothetical protein
VRKRRSSRSRYHRRVRRAVGVLAGVLFLTFGALWLLSHGSSWRSYAYSNQASSQWAQGDSSQNLALLAAESVSATASMRPRVVYPYSVVPGGVESPEDLREISEHDRVVGQHYAGFDFQNAKIIALDRPKLVYLSYRLGNKIFWTSKKVSLRKGEKLITDGTTTARTRCGNQVSEAAQLGISPEEPSLEKFDQPAMIGGSSMQVPFPGAELPGLAPQNPGNLISSLGPIPGGGLPAIYPPPIPTPVCLPTQSKEKGEARVDAAQRNPCSTRKPAPPTIPEPGTILLVASGLAGIYLRRRKSRWSIE